MITLSLKAQMEVGVWWGGMVVVEGGQALLNARCAHHHTGARQNEKGSARPRLTNSGAPAECFSL